MAEETGSAPSAPEHDQEASAAQEDAAAPTPGEGPRKAVIGAIAACAVVVALGAGTAASLASAGADGGATFSGAAASAAAASPSSAKQGSAASAPAASASAASAGAETAPSGAAEATAAGPGGEDRHEVSQAQGTDGGAHEAPAETSSTPAGGDNAAAPAQAAHEHSWEPIYADIQVGEEPIFDYQTVVVVSDGSVFSTSNEAIHYIGSQGRGANLSYHSERQQIQVGSQPIYETQVVGYRCSGCGAEK